MSHATSTNCVFNITNTGRVKEKMLNWVKPFSIFCFLDNPASTPGGFPTMLAAGVRSKYEADTGSALTGLDKWLKDRKFPVFGHLSYDLKNEIEQLQSSHPDRLLFPDICFFEPEVLISISDSRIHIQAEEPARVYEEIMNSSVEFETEAEAETGSIEPVRFRLNREEYIERVKALKKHIRRGDCYEINFCQEFFINAVPGPLQLFRKLSAVSPNPFSAFYRLDDRYLICASPERFLKKEGSRIFSQPIKGTSARDLVDQKADSELAARLAASEKDRAENVMIVDLVRNDLSKVCKESSVKAEELFGIYTFPQVHHMISTVAGIVEEGVTMGEIIRATFPMGSMTGAPKKRVMELIEQYEVSRRGLFSGAVGYIEPSGDFDFNVVIRSIFCNTEKKYLSFQAGSAITWYSDPELEWEECLVKAEAIRKVLS